MDHQSLDGVHLLDKLKDHYKVCIRLNATNKINPKNAFDLQLIDYMRDLVHTDEGGQMNFKIASSALDVGAKIYSNRVDCIQSEAQKVASSILMALDGQKGPADNLDESHGGNDSRASDLANESGAQEDGAPARAKRKAKRVAKTVIEDESLLNGKLEKMVMGDPFLDGLSQDYDMSCPAALICYNSLTQPNGLLTVDSSNLRKDYRDLSERTVEDDLNNFVTLVTKNVNCAQIIRNNQHNQICPRLQDFLFNDRSTKISGLDTNLDETVETLPPMNTNNLAQDGGAHTFDPEQYDDGVGHDDYSDAAEGPSPEVQNENDLIPDLDKLAAGRPSEYVYSTKHHRLLDTWAGPHAWKASKDPQTTRKEPKSTRKRQKLEAMPIDFSKDLPNTDESIANKEIRHSADVLRKWIRKPFRPQDHNFNEQVVESVITQTFLRPEDTYHCMKTPADALKLVDKDHDYASKDGSPEYATAPNSPGADYGGFDDVHDDSDDEFRADPVVDGNEVAIYGDVPNTSLNQYADLEFAGEDLIEQPYTVTQVVIPFAKVAKKMDVRKLKHVMWELLLPPENRNEKTIAEVTMIENAQPELNNVSGDQSTLVEVTKKTPSPTPSEVHLAFSHLYGELPVRVSSKMANDLSQPIAFVTLLHLANEKNLRLIPKQDLKDFIIEQDEQATT